MKYKYVCNYKDNPILRNSFNSLTEKNFGFNFENWYTCGYWGEKYIPHSLCDGEKVIANVSVNIMNFKINGQEKKFIQLGTVMTDKAYRGKGFSKWLIEKVMDTYKGIPIYLFANNSVLNYYPKFGFTKCKEFIYSKKIAPTKNGLIKLNMEDSFIKEKVFNTIKNSTQNSKTVFDNIGLFAFYLAGFMSDMVYYCSAANTYLVADFCNGIATIHDMFSVEKTDINLVIDNLGTEICEVKFYFSPTETKGLKCEEFFDENDTLFIFGEELKIFQDEKLKFPSLSHA